MYAFLIEADGSAKNLEGDTIFISFERFKNNICKNGHCFVCGAAPNKNFNNEHIFPDWLLTYCGLHGKSLTLPNGNLVKYSTYKIPCCAPCNSRLAEIYETPISKIIKSGLDGLIEFVRNGGKPLLCSWLSLIFTKIHLRDFLNPDTLDKRNQAKMIGDHFDLNDLHHAHALARASTAGVSVDERVFGSLFIIGNTYTEDGLTFDYADNLHSQTMMMQFNDFALIYVLNDCGATAGMLSKQLKVLPQHLSDIQLREVYARFATANLHLKKRPSFRTELIGAPKIQVELPPFEIHDYVPEVFGNMLAGCLGNYLETILIEGKTGTEAIEIIKTGKISFLFDESGKPISEVKK